MMAQRKVRGKQDLDLFQGNKIRGIKKKGSLCPLSGIGKRREKRAAKTCGRITKMNALPGTTHGAQR